MSEVKRWKPWFDHTIKQPVMAPETRPGKGYISLADHERAMERIRAIVMKMDCTCGSEGHPDSSYKDGGCFKRDLLSVTGRAGS